MVHYDLGHYVTSRQILDCMEKEDDVIMAFGILDYADENYGGALNRFESFESNDPKVIYATAVTQYQLQEREKAAIGVNRLLAHVEGEWNEAKCRQRNTLVEALTLKSALALDVGDKVAASEALSSISSADPISCHNFAVLSGDPATLAALGPLAPQPSLSNLLVLCLQLGIPEMAADLLAREPKGPLQENVRRLRPLIEALILAQESVGEAQKYLEESACQSATALQQAARLIEEAQNVDDDQAASAAIADYERTLAEFLPLVLCRAKVFWDAGDWEQAELALNGATEFCSETDTYRLLVGNTLFMQGKYAEAAAFYDAAVERADSLLAVNPLVLSHLCVALVMTSQNDRAEKTMHRIEAEEESARKKDPKTKVFHLSLVNLVIGTLYCSKSNFDFGVNRLIWSMEPFERKLGTDTWFHIKRCFLWLTESIAKGSFFPSDTFKQECIKFIDKCELYGRTIKASLDPVFGNAKIHEGKNTVLYESRQLKSTLLKLFYD